MSKRCFILFFIWSVYAIHERVLLKDVQVLTLRAGAFTTGRRNSPVQQLSCQNCNDDAARKAVDTIQCRNVGFDGRDVNWKCETEISKHYKLGRTEVSCEGYENPDDPYILAGSCAVEYHLIHTSPPPPSQSQQQWRAPPPPPPQQRVYVETKTSSQEFELLPFVIFMLILLFIVLLCVNCAATTSTTTVHHVQPASMHHNPVPAPVYYPTVPSTPIYYPPVVHRHTTIVHERDPSPVRYSAPTPSAPAREPSPEKHVSVSHATTKRR